MARVLVIYHMEGLGKWLPAYRHNIRSFRRYSQHECLYLNTARHGVPDYLVNSDPDLILFHYTLLNMRLAPDYFAELLQRIAFTRELSCPKALIAQDEQVRMDVLNDFVNHFGVTQVYSPAPESLLREVYRDVDFDKVTFHPILNGYVDDSALNWIKKHSRNADQRPIDIGYRTWYTQPHYGRHGQLKQLVGRVFSEQAPQYGLTTDISMSAADAFYGNRWFDFLLKCKYTIGVEGGCSVYDWDGSVAQRTQAYVKEHPDASFEQIEAACFPGLDGRFEFYSLSPRQLEAAMTKTCQVLVEGDYGGVLKAGVHYIPLKRDLSNLSEVLEIIRRDDLRTDMVERTYRDVVASGKYSYRAFVDLVLGQLPHNEGPNQRHARGALRNMLDETVWGVLARTPVNPLVRRRWNNAIRESLRPLLSSVLGEDRLVRLMSRFRRPGV